LVAACIVLGAVVFFSPLMEQAGFPAFSILNGFLGASVQALAFLVIGVLASAAVQFFVSDDLLRRIFPKDTGGASILGSVGAALLLSVVLPVCDCSSIPLFRSLVARKVPLPAAVTFLLAAPVANPLVVWSTYFAFNGDWGIVASRCLLGLAVAAAVGLTMLVAPPKRVLLEPLLGSESPLRSGDVSGSASGGVRGHHDHSVSHDDSTASLRERLLLCLEHARADFFDIARYLALGIGVASIFKNVNSAYNLVDFTGLGSLLGIVVMMLAAFVLSLCSSSDAVIGRIFADQMPTSSVLGFLVFGPMFDIKNVLMLSAHFSRRFVARVGGTAFVIAGVGTYLLSLTGVVA
jgi:uncharacterized membrane protein YraQ (UPF0718 family)